MRKQLIAFLIIIASLFGTLFLVYQFTSNDSAIPVVTFKKNSFIYFYGNTCPHCAELNQWLSKNQIDKKLKFEKKEVYQNQTNANLLQKAAIACGLNTNSIGVPFVYYEGRCFVGSDEAKKIFNQELKKLN